MKVLVADDEAVHVFLLELFLKKWGYEVRSTDNGRDALRELESEESPCVAILDWEMPGLTGLEVTRALRKTERRNVYVLMLTAKTQAADRAKALDAGVHAFMTKPYEPEELRVNLLAARKELQDAGYSIA